MGLIHWFKWVTVSGKVKRHNMRGTDYFHDGNLKEAEAEFRESIRIFPWHEVSHTNLGMVLVSMRRYQEAERVLHEAIRIKPGFADAHGELGALYHKMGRKKEAHNEYKLATSLNPINPIFHINFATLCRDEGNFALADAEYRAALASPWIDAETKHRVQELVGPEH